MKDSQSIKKPSWWKNITGGKNIEFLHQEVLKREEYISELQEEIAEIKYSLTLKEDESKILQEQIEYFHENEKKILQEQQQEKTSKFLNMLNEFKGVNLELTTQIEQLNLQLQEERELKKQILEEAEKKENEYKKRIQKQESVIEDTAHSLLLQRAKLTKDIQEKDEAQQEQMTKLLKEQQLRQINLFHHFLSVYGNALYNTCGSGAIVALRHAWIQQLPLLEKDIEEKELGDFSSILDWLSRFFSENGFAFTIEGEEDKEEFVLDIDDGIYRESSSSDSHLQALTSPLAILVVALFFKKANKKIRLKSILYPSEQHEQLHFQYE